MDAGTAAEVVVAAKRGRLTAEDGVAAEDA